MKLAGSESNRVSTPAGFQGIPGVVELGLSMVTRDVT